MKSHTTQSKLPPFIRATTYENPRKRNTLPQSERVEKRSKNTHVSGSTSTNSLSELSDYSVETEPGFTSGDSSRNSSRSSTPFPFSSPHGFPGKYNTVASSASTSRSSTPTTSAQYDINFITGELNIDPKLKRQADLLKKRKLTSPIIIEEEDSRSLAYPPISFSTAAAISKSTDDHFKQSISPSLTDQESSSSRSQTPLEFGAPSHINMGQPSIPCAFYEQPIGLSAAIPTSGVLKTDPRTLQPLHALRGFEQSASSITTLTERKNISALDLAVNKAPNRKETDLRDHIDLATASSDCRTSNYRGPDYFSDDSDDEFLDEKRDSKSDSDLGIAFSHSDDEGNFRTISDIDPLDSLVSGMRQLNTREFNASKMFGESLK